jgi:hypothetical protein
MQWITPSERDAANDAPEKRLWAGADLPCPNQREITLCLPALIAPQTGMPALKQKPKTKTMSKEKLETLEKEVNAELYAMAASERSIHNHDPITDGVIDIERYLSSSPKMLWILKEPWEDLNEGDAGGDWSVTRGLILKNIAEGTLGNTAPFAPIAYVTYSVLNNYPKWDDISYVTKDPRVGESLKSIAYINVNKFPGKTTSVAANIELCYRRNRHILLRQIATINPDVVIGGSTLHLFFDDLELRREEFKTEGSAAFCAKAGRLYIDAYHPSQRGTVKHTAYVDDIVSVIKQHRQVSDMPQKQAV